MGKLVTFWSPYIGRAKVTSTLCAVAGGFGILYPDISIAISHSVPGSMELEEKLDFRSDRKGSRAFYEKFGISALAVNYMQSVLTSEKIRRCGIPLFMKSLTLYPNVKEKVMDELFFYLLSEGLVKEYDVLFLDLDSGDKKDSRRLMEAADLIVVVLPQAPAYWNDFWDKEAEWLEGKKYTIILGGYLEKSRNSLGYYTRKKKGRGDFIFAGTIPMNAGYLDAMAEGKALHFFMENQLALKKEDNYEFIHQAKKTAENIKKSIFVS